MLTMEGRQTHVYGIYVTPHTCVGSDYGGDLDLDQNLDGLRGIHDIHRRLAVDFDSIIDQSDT